MFQSICDASDPSSNPMFPSVTDRNPSPANPKSEGQEPTEKAKSKKKREENIPEDSVSTPVRLV